MPFSLGNNESDDGNSADIPMASSVPILPMTMPYTSACFEDARRPDPEKKTPGRAKDS
jgi:hypothetical protein